jgi:hypothetical protein
MGPVALHGGGEFLPGDEKFLLALLRAAERPAEERARSCGRAGPDEPVRIVVMPTAAADHDPDGSARHGTLAFERLVPRLARPVQAEMARVVDAASADDATLAARIAAADLVYLPGGDPAVIPGLLPDSAAWRSILAARARGAILAGASAGAMALAPMTWTPNGIVTGLSVVRGLVVFPHADAAMWDRQAARFPPARSAGMGILGLGERTGIISTDGDGRAPGPTVRWQVVGQGEVRWLAPGASEPAVLVDGESLELPA